jgi:DNA processing protein
MTPGDHAPGGEGPPAAAATSAPGTSGAAPPAATSPGASGDVPSAVTAPGASGDVPSAVTAVGASGAAPPGATACDACLRRTDLLTALAGWIDVEWRRHDAEASVLALPDERLLAIATDAIRRRFERFDAEVSRAVAQRAGVKLVCRCSGAFPARVRALPDPPAVLHVVGDPAALDVPEAVAIVGARRATSYGLEVSRALGRGLSRAGVPVVSGLALGIDAAAHEGALEGSAAPVAVLAAAPDVPYPMRNRTLHAAVAAHGAVVSEFPPGSNAFRWCFVARNRIVAALAQVVVIVEAAERSGSLTTADFAADLGCTVAAVPGRVTNRTAAGTNALLQCGAALVRDAGDVLDLLAETTGRPRRHAPARRPPPDLAPELLVLLAAVEEGRGALGELAASGEEARAVLAGLGELEFRGLIRRTFGGRYEPAAR